MRSEPTGGRPSPELRVRSLFGGGGGGQAADLVDDRRVGQGRRVTEDPALGHVAEQSAHDLPAPGLGQLVGEDHVAGPGDGTDLVGDVGSELLASLVVTGPASARRVTKATMAWPVVASLAPTTAASATDG